MVVFDVQEIYTFLLA